jgi:hypothetical protein
VSHVTHGLTIDAALFALLMKELADRGAGSRESGAFLLTDVQEHPGARHGGWLSVTALAFYDDLDPDCLTGGITFGANGYSALGARCRRDHVRVVGDIHTHPRDWVGQSITDSTHPMAVLTGHIALISPNYGQGDVTANALGAHVFHGSGAWTSYYGNEVKCVFRLTGFSTVRRVLHRLRRLGRLMISWRP